MLRAQPTASHHIAGAYIDDSEGAPMACLYPATGDKVAELHEATPALIERALAAAQAAQPEWAATAPAERGRILARAAAIMRERNHDLSVLETLDTGKPLQETLVADAASGADALEYFGGLAAGLQGQMLRLAGGDFCYAERVPLGVCVGIGAWNYPTQIACWKAAPCLAAGNAMVFKPSEVTPLGALTLAEILTEAGLPPGVFNVVQGAGAVGAALVNDARTAKVSLTGSVATGHKVYAAAAAGMKQATMELGGKSPLVVFADADLEDAVSGAILGNFYSSGQICSNGTRVFVERPLRGAFVARMVERLAGVVMGDPLDEATNFGPLVSERQLESVMGFIRKGEAEGATLACGGHRANRPGWFVEPTVFTDVTDEMTIAREEIFGPVLSVLDFDSEEEVIARANATPYGLAAGVFTADLARGHRVIGRIQAGTGWINTYNLTPAGMPFGGMKLSGFGRENAAVALESYTQLKSTYVATGPVEAPF
ncbi:betaine-aldehyde dehydrogenase [Frigidibacter sp. ROC022]|uniref:betaine-aldehyde dehydrogenase n=1 Tax=Frigidibacter sp. ROC022 TaxID=2971796 RepID=UPI00215B3B1E|nr:betaine-aldehyde dehydrogenase [Frigidibacter sp. ROC022]MCR8725829.1 betaine-aldehyde dehydrogenase [Frigidibacter sp. ROC022]